MPKPQDDNAIAARLTILRAFTEMKRGKLDLHVFFEAAGNEMDDRERLLDAIEELEREDLIESRGGDFYSLTATGVEAATAQMPVKSSARGGMRFEITVFVLALTFLFLLFAPRVLRRRIYLGNL